MNHSTALYPDISCAVLAGGKNSRFGGRNKAFAEVNGQRIFATTLTILKELFNEIIVVSNNPSDYATYTGITTIPDIIKDIGPLGGIYTALKSTTKNAVFFVACDMPFLNKNFITNEVNYFISSNVDAVVPIANNLTEPLHSVFSTNIINTIEAQIKSEQYSVFKLFDHISVKYLKTESEYTSKDIFLNINTLKDLQNLQS